MDAKRISQCLVGATALAAALTGATVATAQEGYYDRYGNFIEFAPPPVYDDRPPIYAEPPPVLRRAPPVYAEPPPVIYYEEPPPVYAPPPPGYGEPPPGWGRRVLVLPPEEIPEARYVEPPPQRRYEEPPPQRQYIEPRVPDDYFIEADPDAEYEEPPTYSETPPEPEPERIEPEVAEPSDPQRVPLEPPQPEVRTARQDPGRALSVVPRYAAAKAAAMEMSDDFKRTEEIRKINAWLVSASVQPATAGTIRALDRLAGIKVTEQSTALPGAGIEIVSPKKGESKAGHQVVRLLQDYADVKGDILRAADRSEEAQLAAEAEQVVEAEGVDLDEAEIAGLDAFLGLADPNARIAQRTAEPDRRTEVQ